MLGSVRIRAAFVLVAFGFAASAAAQQSRHHSFQTLPTPVEAEEFQATLSTDEREIYELLEDLLAIRLKRALGGDRSKMTALQACAGEHTDQLTMLKWLRASARDHLRWSLGQDVGEAEIANLLDTLLHYEQQIASVLANMVESSRTALSPADSARLYLFVDDFEEFVGDQIAAIVSESAKSKADAAPEPVEGDAPDSFETLVRRENRDVALEEFAGEDIIELVDALLMVRLAETLDLESEEMMRLFARVGSHKDQLHELKWQIGGARQKLRAAIESDAPPKELVERTNDLLMQEQAVAQLVRDFIEGAREDVSERQAAKLYLFLGDFEDYIVGLLQRANG